MTPIITKNSSADIHIVDASNHLSVVTESVWILVVTAEWKATYTVIAYDNASINIDLTTWAEYTDLTIAVLALAKDPNSISIDLSASLSHSHSTYNIHMVTLYGTWWNATINWNVIMVPWVQKVEGHLLEENIIIGEWVQIKTLPMLDVQSNDVIASHGARVEKLNAKQLFYLQSKGISKDDATALMIWWYIDHTLQWVADEEIIKNYKQFCLTYILA